MHKIKGFTLIEVLLLMVVITIIIMTGTTYIQQKTELMREDVMASQMQSILNAGLLYYVGNGKWPGTPNTEYDTSVPGSSPLVPNYLPNRPISNPYGTSYVYGYLLAFSTFWNVSPDAFVIFAYVGVTAKQQAISRIIAGKLPNGQFNSGWILAYVNPPGQNVANATAMNFAGLYHHGACIPVPVCPVDAKNIPMNPQVFIVPISTSGLNESGNTHIYAISSFTAYATGNNPLDNNPPLCTNETTTTGACSGGGANNQYWRACVQIITARGDVALTRIDNWGQNVTMAAFTRCSITGEPSGSTFAVYGN